MPRYTFGNFFSDLLIGLILFILITDFLVVELHVSSPSVVPLTLGFLIAARLLIALALNLLRR